MPTRVQEYDSDGNVTGTELPNSSRVVEGTIKASVMCAAFLFGLSCGGSNGSQERMILAPDTVADTIILQHHGPIRDTIRLVPEFTIGRFEGPDHYIFSQVTAVAADSGDNIYVADRSFGIRKYDSHGQYLATIGALGSGPGEYEDVSALSLLSQDRLAVRDQGNARIVVFNNDGTAHAHWSIPPLPIARGNPLASDENGWLYVPVRFESARSGPSTEDVSVLRFSDNGLQDTLTISLSRIRESCDAPSVEGRRVIQDVFVPAVHWVIEATGAVVVGCSADLSQLIKESGAPRVLKVVRPWSPIVVPREEREGLRGLIERQVNLVFSADWKWVGPPIPAHKPAFEDVHIGSDGRIWIRLFQPSRAVPMPDQWRQFGPTLWRPAPGGYDQVWDRDGYDALIVQIDDQFLRDATPAFGSDRVVAATMAADSVPRVTSYSYRREPMVRTR